MHEPHGGGLPSKAIFAMGAMRNQHKTLHGALWWYASYAWLAGLAQQSMKTALVLILATLNADKLCV